MGSSRSSLSAVVFPATTGYNKKKGGRFFWPGFLLVVFFSLSSLQVTQHIACCFKHKILKWFGDLDSAGLVHSRNLQVLHKFISRCSSRCHLLPCYEEEEKLWLRCRHVTSPCHRKNCVYSLVFTQQLNCDNSRLILLYSPIFMMYL